MNCDHRHLILLPGEKHRLRCRHCHLIIKADELGDGHCPECWEIHGKKYDDFDVMETNDTQSARYRCEECGAMIEAE